MTKRILAIEVGHIRVDRDQYGVYVGRSMPGLEGSLLGNPFKLTSEALRDKVISQYRGWLWQQIKARGEVYQEFMRLLEMAESSSCLSLLCWCRRMNQREPACHADVIASALQSATNNREEVEK